MNLSLAPVHAAAGPVVQLAVDPNKVTPGLLGFVVFAAIGGAVWFLMKSMNKQFGKVDFKEEPPPGNEAGAPAGREQPKK